MNFSTKLSELKKMWNLGDKSKIEDQSFILFEYLRFWINIIGCDIFRENFSMLTKKFIFTIFMIFMVGYCYFYTMYRFRNDFEAFVFVTATVNMEFQGIAKIYTFVIKRTNLIELKNFCQKFILFHSEFSENERMKKCFEKWFLIAMRLVIVISIYAFFVLLFLIIGPLILTMYFKKNILVIGFILPYFDKATFEGYTINYILQSLGSVVCVLGFIAALVVILVILIHFLAFYDSLEVLLEMLQNVLKSRENENSRIFDDEIKRLLKKLIGGHNLCYEFIDGFESSFQFYHLSEIGGSMFATAVSVFAMMKVNSVRFLLNKSINSFHQTLIADKLSSWIYCLFILFSVHFRSLHIWRIAGKQIRKVSIETSRNFLG